MQKPIRKRLPWSSALDQREQGRLPMTSNPPRHQPESCSSRHTIRKLLTCLGLVSIAISWTSTAMADERFYNFNPPNGDPNGTNGFILFGTQRNVSWITNNGASGAPGDGFLEITGPVGGQNLGVLFPLDYFTNADQSLVALPLKGFFLEADVRIGNPTGNNGRPADGFSISFAHSDDPIVYWGKQIQFRGWAGGDSTGEALEPNTYNYATGVGTLSTVDAYNQCGSSTAENGTKTGVSVQFDTWQGNTIIDENGLSAGGNDNVGWRVHFDGKMLQRIRVPQLGYAGPGGDAGNNLNGLDVCPPVDPTHADFSQDPACSPLVCPDTNTMQTGVYTLASSGDVSNLCWTHLSVELTTNFPHLLTVKYKTRTLVDHQVLSNFFPYVGQIVMGGRTGGANENRDVDNVHIITYPSVQAVFNGITSASGFVDDFTLKFANIGPAKVTAFTALTLDGVDILNSPLTKKTISDPFSTVVYTITDPTKLFPSGSGHSIVVTFTDAIGNTTTTPVSFSVGSWSFLNGLAAVPAASVDLTKPGFNVQTYQTTMNQVQDPLIGINSTPASYVQSRVMDNSVRRAQEQLAGLLGPNSLGTNVVETGVINYSINVGGILPSGFSGDFTQATDPNNANRYNQLNFPGVPDFPGGDPTTDNLAADVGGVLYFPDVGYYTITVNSDDGFALYFGNPANDVFHSAKVLEFNGGKGASDISTTLYVPTNGYYPYRLVYYNGGGGASLELIAKEDGPNPTVLNPFKILSGNLVNDSTLDSIKSFQATSAAHPAAVTFITPMPNEGTYMPNATIAANITDGSDGAIKSAVNLWVNGTAVSPTINKSGAVTTLSYTPPATSPLPAGSNWLAIAFTDASNKSQTNTVPFNTVGYVSLPPSMALPASAVDTTKSGFNIYTSQAKPRGPGDTTTITYPNAVWTAEMEVHLLTGTTTLMGWLNEANLAAFTGPGGTYIESPSTANHGVINYNGSAGNNGIFLNTNSTAASQGDMPGIPTLNNTIKNGDYSTAQPWDVDNYALDIKTVLNLQPGVYQMGGNSDDGFALTFGNPNEWSTLKLLVSKADYGKGTSDVDGYVYVSKAGLYPARFLFFEGGGGNAVEFYTKPSPWPDNNWHALVNDSAAVYTNSSGAAVFPAIQAYQYPIGTTKGSPYISSIKPSPDRAALENGSGTDGNVYHPTHTGVDSPVVVTLVDGETAIDTATVKLWVNGTLVVPSVTKSGTTTTVNYTPPATWTPNTTNYIQLAFLDRTVNWRFEVENHASATFFIEAEDYNFGGGQTMAAASTMPYYGGAYAGQGGVTNTDYARPNQQNNGWYRTTPTAGQVNVPYTMNYDLDRGVNEVIVNNRIGWVGANQWYNYTRTFPTSTNKYNVYVGLGQGNAVGTSPHARYAVLQTVDSPTVPTSTNTLGIFDDVASGNYGQNGGVGTGVGLVPLTDGNGNMVSVTLSGTQTLRMYFPAANTNAILNINGNLIAPHNGNGDFDYLLFTPAATQIITHTVSAAIVGGQVKITFTGTLFSSPTVNGTYTAVAGATGTTYTVPSGSGAALFFRAH
jgi:GLEYA domain-containing protein